MADDESATLRLGLYENDTGELVPKVAYIINMTEQDGGSGKVSKEVFRDMFFAENGTLVLNLSSSDENMTQINGNREQFLNAWIPANANESITVSSPQIREDRMYNVQVSIFSLYNIRNIPPPDETPKVDFVWSPQDGNARTEVVIVPEFNLIMLPILLPLTIGVAIACSRIRR